MIVLWTSLVMDYSVDSIKMQHYSLQLSSTVHVFLPVVSR